MNNFVSDKCLISNNAYCLLAINNHDGHMYDSDILYIIIEDNADTYS